MTPDRPADGASAERTRLAWRRTVLSSTTVALLAIKVATRAHPVAVEVVGIIAVLAGWLAQLTVAHRRIQAMAHQEPPHVRRSLPATALLAASLALLGIVLTLTT